MSTLFNLYHYFMKKKIHFREKESSNYVHHPINAFHLIKRLVVLDKYKSELSDIIPHWNFNTKSINHDFQRAFHGMTDLVEIVGLHPSDLAKGLIKHNRKTYKARSGLSATDLIQIADEAKEVDYLVGYVDWLIAALKKAKKEGKDAKFIKKLK